MIKELNEENIHENEYKVNGECMWEVIEEIEETLADLGGRMKGYDLEEVKLKYRIFILENAISINLVGVREGRISLDEELIRYYDEPESFVNLRIMLGLLTGEPIDFKEINQSITFEKVKEIVTNSLNELHIDYIEFIEEF